MLDFIHKPYLCFQTKMVFSILQKMAPDRIKAKAVINRWYSDDSGSHIGKLNASHKVDNLEKRFLVWTGKYKTLKDVPAFVSQAVMEKTRNRMRIKIANYMMAATALGCALMVYLGKQDQESGKSVLKMNLDWHKQINEDYKKEQDQAKKE